MNKIDIHNERIAKMTFSSVYPMYLQKVEKKGRTKAELDQVISWLTGYSEAQLNEMISNKVNLNYSLSNLTCIPMRS